MNDTYYIRSLVVTIAVMSVVLAAMLSVVYWGGTIGLVIVVAPVALLASAFYGVFGFFRAPHRAPLHGEEAAAAHYHEIESREKTSQVKG